MFTLSNVRSTFLDYFEKKNHKILASSPLIPHNDPSLMFTNSGMVQFKNIFTGEEKQTGLTRAVTAQKCVRAGGKHNDLDNVGYTARHHTFFEMLGNFSFGDYFKEDAIFFAWDLLTKYFELPKDKLYVTVYHDDIEAINLWKKITGFSDDKIIKISTNDNFWSMGDTGPCGPCSEIFYDHGSNVWGGLPGTKDQDGDRYIEIWNLVFMQYEQLANGERIDLPKQSIDTGMGIERIAAVLQSVHNNYEIDLFKNLINQIADLVKVKIEGDALVSYRVIADHLRSTAFLITDGVLPSNEGRGYVLRRILRRAMRHIHQLGFDKDLLMPKLVLPLINEMGSSYPELIRAQKLVEEVFAQEELRFKATLTRGLKLLDEEVAKITNHTLPGEVAFKLYDTYGFPLDLTVDILKNKNININIDEFDQQMKLQKERARANWVGSGEKVTDEIWFDIYQQHGATEFLGYNQNMVQAKVIAVVDYTDNMKIVVTNQTPFYGESGGQLGDIGDIVNQDGNIFKVSNTLKFLGKIHGHVTDAKISIGEIVSLKIDQNHRRKLRANHSATHILHFVLRKQLGEQVTQKGSLVASDRLRFDFSFSRAISKEELLNIENEVNEIIIQNNHSQTKLMNIEQAIEAGAMALFGEKYDEEVRVVSIADSVELCGGTHVEFTGEIGLFKIISESGISAGVRRIEAKTGMEALKMMQEQDNLLSSVSEVLKTPQSEILSKIQQHLTEKKKLESEIKNLKQKMLTSANEEQKFEMINQYCLIIKNEDDVPPQDLRSMVDILRNKFENAVVIAVSQFESKSSMVIGLNNNINNLNASDIVRICCAEAGGNSGGGKPQLAQAGGFDYSQAEKAVNYLRNMLKEI